LFKYNLRNSYKKFRKLFFGLKSGIKQVGVLVPTLFVIHLCAILRHAFHDDSQKDIGVGDFYAPSQ